MDELSLTRAHRDHVQHQIESGRFAKNAFGLELANHLLEALNEAIGEQKTLH